jgi:hypothetical protein
MGPDSARLIDPSILNRNLAALQEVDAPLAREIEQTVVPESVQNVIGRDGKPTFRVTGNDGVAHWFGGSSAPSVSAPALVKSFDPGRTNVLLDGIGHGTELAILLQRLEVHRGVLVIETDPLALALALRLHDFSAAIRGHRLSVLRCDAEHVENRLAQFLATNEGYLPPERILRWPWRSDEGVLFIQQAVERVANAANRARSEALTSIAAAWAQANPKPAAECPRVAIVSTRAIQGIWDWMAEMTSACEALGWPVLTLPVRSPMDCQMLRFARRLAEYAPDWVLAIESSFGDIRAVAGPKVPIAYWTESPASTGGGVGALRQNEVMAATSPTSAEILMAIAAASKQVAIVPHGIASTSDDKPSFGGRPIEVAVFADAGPLDPGSYGVALHTQQVLWRECVSFIRKDLDSYVDTRAEGVLAAAERATKTAIRDETARDAFIQAVRDVIGPQVIAQGLVSQLCRAGIRVGVWGRGWDPQSGLEIHGPAASIEAVRQALDQSRLCVVVGTTGCVDRSVLAAVDRGCVVVWRRHACDGQPGGMAALFADGKHYQGYRSSSELVKACRRLLKDANAWAKVAQSAGATLSANHTLQARLRELRHLLLQEVT